MKKHARDDSAMVCIEPLPRRSGGTITLRYHMPFQATEQMNSTPSSTQKILSSFAFLFFVLIDLNYQILCSYLVIMTSHLCRGNTPLRYMRKVFCVGFLGFYPRLYLS